MFDFVSYVPRIAMSTVVMPSPSAQTLAPALAPVRAPAEVLDFKYNPKYWRNGEIYYPDSDGEPVANNIKHMEYIEATKYGLQSLFAERDDVMVAADLFWYPVEGNPTVCVAPDVMIAVGRPRRARPSYKQWKEDDIAPQVVFEFLSEANTTKEMAKKAMFFERYGVEEYYLYDIETRDLTGFVRNGNALAPIEPDLRNWVSPHLGIRFAMEEIAGEVELAIYKPDGTRFRTYWELIQMGVEFGAMQAKLTQTETALGIANVELERLREKMRLIGLDPDVA
jgi:Uma2 family endonuclease